MKPAIYLYVLFLAGMFACQPSPQEAPPKEGQKPEESLEQMPFEVFLKRFNLDTGFQLSRIEFPLDIVSYQENENYEFEEVTQPLAKVEWEPTSLDYEEETSEQTNDAFTQSIAVRQDSAFVQFRGVNNGIYVDYVFAIKMGVWNLVVIKDYSM